MTNILCIDVGGTRIKAAILKDNITLNELVNSKVKTMETLGWLNSSLPQIISKNHFASLIYSNEGLDNYDIIAIGVPCKVINRGKKIGGYYIDQCGVPSNLMQAFKDRANCEIVITNDGIAWMRGALNYFQLCSINIKFPCIAVILGTGVGLAYAYSAAEIEYIEASEQKYIFSHLGDAVEEDVCEGAKIHRVLGGRFFSDVKDRYRKWTYLKIRNEYTERLLALFSDFEEGNLFNYKDAKSIIIGGGNSKYLSLSSLKCSLNKSIYMMNKSSVNPDLIPLLGLNSLINQPLLK